MDNTTLEVMDGIKDLGVYYDSLLLIDKCKKNFRFITTCKAHRSLHI